ncbi:MAG TPA: O-antigen ligase family protein [Sphingomicrobium sp.]
MVASRVREAVAPAYLFLCLLLGGSAQGIWANAILQLAAVGIMAWAAMASPPGPIHLERSARRLVQLFGLGLAVIAIQLIPLPPSLWTSLPGRRGIEAGFDLLGQPLPWLPISLTPDESLSTLIRLLPPVAIIAAMLWQQAYRASWLAWALVAGTAAGVTLGALQVTSGAGPDSPWYLYPISNFGTATGFFANGNHMAILLVATIPFLFALIASGSRARDQKALQRRSALFALAGGMLAIVALGLVLNGSLAGFGLGLPVLAASAILLLRPERQRRWLIAPGLLLLAAVAAIVALPVTASFQSLGASTSVESRRTVTETCLQAAGDFMPVGSGLGSYERVYRLYEDPAGIDRTYVNHAHNDFLEIAVETGLPGLIIVLLFLGWWVVAAWKAWGGGATDPFAKAAAIASAAVLAHSLVDFPLRTAAISAVFAASLILMVRPRVQVAVATESDLWPTRHLEIR